MRGKERGLGGALAADRMTDYRPEPSASGRKLFCQPGACLGEEAQQVEGRRVWSACLLPASAPSLVSLQLPKRQLLILAVGASALQHRLSSFSPPPVLLFLFCSEPTEPTEKSELGLQGLRPATGLAGLVMTDGANALAAPSKEWPAWRCLPSQGGGPDRNL